MKKMQTCVLMFTVFCACHSAAQDPQLASPAGWNKETFPLPPSFASFFPYHGKEVIRFCPGWGSKGQPDYWSYAYLWFLENTPDLSTATMEKALNSYYTGLIASNIPKRNIPNDKVFPVAVQLVQARKDSPSWTGTVKMLDYMAQEPVLLHIRIRPVAMQGAGRYCLFLELSPVAPGKGIWQQMDSLIAVP